MTITVNNNLIKSKETFDTQKDKSQKYRQTKKESGDNYKRNFADKIQHLENLVNSHPFVQSILHSKDKVPSIILYTDEQLVDIRRCCI